MSGSLELSMPFNWCDSMCERCVLEAECPAAARLAERAGAPFEEAVTESLTEAVTMLEKEARERGIDLEDLPAPPPKPFDARLLEDAASAYVHAIRELDTGHSALSRATLLYSKIGKLVTYMTFESSDEVWAMDGVPNLILVEGLLDELHAATPQNRAGVHAREQRLRSLLVPLFESIPRAAREIIAILTAARRAPSPFVIR